MSQIKFVYFDTGDVLFEWRDVLDRFEAMSNKSFEETLAVFTKYDDDVCRGKITPQQLWKYLKKELGMKEEIDNFIDWWNDNFKPIQAMHQLVRDIAKKYKIGVLTNIYEGSFVRMLAQGNIPNIAYDAVIQSCELGFIKPEEEIYEFAQKSAMVLASEILFIDNKTENIDKAKELGWQTVWYDVENHHRSEEEIRQVLGLNS